ncbi:hypothetical protein LJK87_32790 [Paenibacillus sp. P25]|nr:hypothetical protein LJK87_32790 [Paenibacillus sp. P25]
MSSTDRGAGGPEAARGMSGTSDSLWTALLKVFERFSVKRVWLVASRTNKAFPRQAEFHMAVDAPEMTERQLESLDAAIGALAIFYPMKLVHVQALESVRLQQSIERNGMLLYENQTEGE